MPGLGNSEGWASGPTDFDDEYGYFCELMNGGIERMDEETSTLNEHRDSLKKIKLIKLLEEDDDIERIKADVLQARKTVFAVEKFLKEDWNNSLTTLREALSGYIKALAEKITLKKISGKYVIVGTVSGKNLVVAARLLAELKELETMVANLEGEVERMAAHQEIDGFDVQELLDNATTKHEKNREEEERDAEKERKRQKEEERRRKKEEERLRKEEEERLRREEEERKREEEERRRREEEERRKAEEEERKRIEEEERKQREEEERLRREEEERRRKAEEEERKRREEEERRRKEEEEARRREDERLWKADPRDWPALIYELPNSQDPVGSGVACAIRAPDDYLTLHKEQFVCEFVSWQQNRYRPADNEEVVSSMIRLRPADGTTMKFKTRVWIAIAYAGASKNRETVIRFQAINGPNKSVSAEQEEEQEPAPESAPESPPEPEAEAEAETAGEVNPELEQDQAAETNDAHGQEAETGESRKENQPMEVQQPDSGPPAVARVSVSAPTNPVAPVVNEPAPPPEWIDVMMRETNVMGYETFRFIETPITELDANGVNIIVVTRPKTDSDTWNNKGGRLVSSVDSRVSITAPKNAFRLTTDIKLQVIALDSSALNGLKERYDTCDQLIGSSPLLVISMSNKPSKPLAISVTNPSGGGKKPKKDPSGKTLPQSGKPQGRGNGPQDQDDVLSVLVKDVGGKWRHRDSVALDQQRDCVVFQLDGAPQCVIILRTQPGVDSAELGRIAADLETSTHERPAQLVVRQHADNPNLVFIECCRRDAVDKLIAGRFQTLQFTDGPDPSRLFVLREGDLVEITFRDNIRAIDGFDGPRQFVFNSNMPTLDLQLNVKEVEPYAQNALSVYRGFVRLSLVERAYQPPPRLATMAAGGLITANRKPPPGVAKNAAADKNMVAEVMLNLPKPSKAFCKINRANIGINGPPPLCVEYFDKLAADLGDDWLQLANQLKVAPAAAQRIIRENSNLDEPVMCSQRAARVMLGQWYRSQSKSNQKVEDLKAALNTAGRNDLAEDLYTKYKEARLEQDRKLEDIHLQKSIKEFFDESSAVKLWREAGSILGLNAAELEAIGGPAPRLTPRKVVVDAKQARVLAQQMLEKWKESAGEKATSESLLGSVKKLRLAELAARISAIRDAT